MLSTIHKGQCFTNITALAAKDTLTDQFHLYSHFTDHETEACRVEIPIGLHLLRWGTQDRKPKTQCSSTTPSFSSYEYPGSEAFHSLGPHSSLSHLELYSTSSK